MKVMQGTVTSVKTAKTATVTVVRQWQHPVYKKYVKRTKKYACHIDTVEVSEGDLVTITECRPISKTKNFVITAKSDKSKPAMIKEEDIIAEVKEVKEKTKKTK